MSVSFSSLLSDKTSQRFPIGIPGASTVRKRGILGVASGTSLTAMKAGAPERESALGFVSVITLQKAPGAGW